MNMFDDALRREAADLTIAKASPLWAEAVAFLRRELVPQVKTQIHHLVETESDDWPYAYHFRWGMGIRNLLREHGYGEKQFGIENLDNIYVALVEAAVTEETV